MKIRLIRDVPIDPKHETFQGRIFEVTEQRASHGEVWVKGATGEAVLIRRSEYEVIKEEDINENQID